MKTKTGNPSKRWSTSFVRYYLARGGDLDTPDLMTAVLVRYRAGNSARDTANALAPNACPDHGFCPYCQQWHMQSAQGLTSASLADLHRMTGK